MYEHNALGYRSGLALCLTKVRSSRARCSATALIVMATPMFQTDLRDIGQGWLPEDINRGKAEYVSESSTLKTTR